MNKELLEKREKELLNALDDIKHSAAPVDLNEPIGRLSRMDAMANQQISLARKKEMELSLEQIKAAKVRLENGEYGICVICEEEISENRLKAKPETPFCINCTKV